MATKKNQKQNTESTINSGKSEPSFLKKNALVLSLVGVIIISIVWGIISKQSTARKYERQLTELKESHAAILDSMKIHEGELFISALSWACRSEMMRENMDQVNSYFLEALKNTHVLWLQIIDHKTGNIVLSTNKKDEGSKSTDDFIVKATAIASRSQEQTITYVAPIYSFNQQLGVLVMEKSK